MQQSFRTDNPAHHTNVNDDVRWAKIQSNNNRTFTQSNNNKTVTRRTTMAELLLHGARAFEREEAANDPTRDQSEEVPLPLSTNPNVVCIDIKRRCIYPYGTQSADEPFFWKRTVTSSFRKSYLYLLHLLHAEEHDEPTATQAQWWNTSGPEELSFHNRRGDGCLPVDPPYPPSGQPWSIVCYDTKDKSLWHMDSPTNHTMRWRYNTRSRRHLIHWYLFMLTEEWEDHEYIRTPLEFSDPGYETP